ncbi:hypothetical protein BKK79_38200 (plasmid) [Cupriavidus sp. USMAA2-4]|uniref:hypothetical protein n=1 Tax=Cupriavidus sp. USMAA2-4 TaxID=876364 RepID=UPI0008A6E015|nr:hypothetical protein [Cupriavidus sp. USMAA2-4]AOY97752.1 hypothetical protein BKK79_38200 [Cupriavidus sp. USMAA2-4]
MYVISIGPERVASCTTLAGVLASLHAKSGWRPGTRPQDVQVRHIARGTIPVVALPQGKLGLRPAGTMRTVFQQIVDEVDQYLVRVDGKILRPHEMSRAAWEAVATAGSLGCFAEWVVDLGQAESGPLFATRDLFEEAGPFDPHAFMQAEFRRRFGYGTNGPEYAPGAGCNARHEVHVAYALLRGERVRECVLKAYRDDPEICRHDLHWLRLLLDVPGLRGALPPAQLRALCNLIRHEHLATTPEHIFRMLTVIRRLRADCSAVAVDDALYEAGLLPARTVPMPKLPEGEAAAPVTALASRLHELVTEKRYRESVASAESRRKALSISQREFERELTVAEHEKRGYGYSWPNKLALAVMQRDVALLLDVLDTPADRNAQSKKAVRDVLGISLLNCNASTRRRRIFDMCGFSEEEQRVWEDQSGEARAVAQREHAVAEATRNAEAARWRIESGRVMNGREYVDMCIAEGFSEIVQQQRGSAHAYYIRDAHRSVARPLRAKDGTLAYARARLQAAPVAVAA